MTIYKNWISENQRMVDRLLQEELDYWLSQVNTDAVEQPRSGGVAHAQMLMVPVIGGITNIDVQNRVMTALLFALYRITNSVEHIVFREGHGRNPLNKYDVSGAIGWFTCKYPTKYDVVQDSIVRTLDIVAANNAAVPNGGVGYDVLKYFGPSYINRQLDCPAGILFNYLGDLSFTPAKDTDDVADKLILSAHSGFSSSIENSAELEDSLFGLNVNTWIENGVLHCSLDVAPSLGLDAARCKRFIELVQAHLKELLSGEETDKKVKVIPFQKGLISYVFSNPGSDNYINQNVFEADMEISYEFFKKVCKTLTAKYEILRTCYSFDYATGEFTGSILSADTLNCDYFTIAGRHELNALLLQVKQRKFKIDEEPLIRFSLIRTDDGKNIIVITSHHIIIDGTSVMYLLNELMNIASDLRAGKEVVATLPASQQFSAYADWVDSRNEQEAVDYWKQLLAGTVPGLLENHSVGETDQPQFGDLVHRFVIDNNTASVLKAQHITNAAALNYAVGFMLAKYAGKNSFVWGNTVTVRPFEMEGMETIVGPCIATIPVKMNFDSDEDIFESIRLLQLQLLESQEHAYLTLNDISRTAGYQQLFSASYVYQNFVKTEFNEQQAVSYTAHFAQDGNISSHFPLNILVYEENESIAIRVKYRADYFTKHLIKNICAAISSLFNNIAQLSQPVKAIDIFETCGVRPSELQGDVADLSKMTLHGAFMEAAKTNPENIAVIDGERSLSYHELDGMSNAVCKLLIDNNISGAVGIRMKRSANMIAVIAGILKSGAHLVSLERDFPDEKVQWIDKNIGLSAVFADEGENLRVNCRIFPVSTIQPLYNYHELPVVSPGALCCINYTSGSTGVPKLVKISHAGHVNRVLWLQNSYAATTDDIYGFKTLLCFGPSLREVFEPLMQGSSLYVYSDECNNQPQLFFNETKKHKVTRLFLTPTFIRLLIDCELQNALEGLKYLEISGEPIGISLFEKLRTAFPRTRIVGRYGATEAPGTVYNMGNVYESKRNLPLGSPIYNTGISVLNEDGRVLPAGVIGEIGIYGESISTGYINKELEVGNFLSVDGKMHVKTGDLGYVDHNDVLVFQSRKTRMVKIKGYRVEPAEIEYNLLQHAAIKKAIVVPVITKNSTRLTAFYIKNEAVEPAALRAFLEQRLPRYMVPHEFTEITKLPLTESGKVDYVGLSKYAVANTAGGTKPPASETEKQLFDIISQLVEHTDFDVQSNFVEIGMDSILTLKATYRIRKTFNVDADVSDVYMNPTVEELSAFVERKLSGNVEGDEYYFVNYNESNGFLFFVPPIGNSQLDLKTLERAVPANVTLVIFKPVSAERSAQVTLEEIAAGYNKLLKTIGKDARVNISGWSLGGTIAYEMAVQLQQQGVEIGNVLLFDPGFYTPAYDANLTKEKLNDILDGMMGQNKGNTEIRENILTDILTANKLIVEYKPSGFTGKIRLFKPTDISSEERNYNKELNGLEQFCKAEIEVIRLPGNHMTMLGNVLQNRQIIEELVK
jgi:non-ribosomal peptide synthase protein (TIGR01720 family)